MVGGDFALCITGSVISVREAAARRNSNTTGGCVHTHVLTCTGAPIGEARGTGNVSELQRSACADGLHDFVTPSRVFSASRRHQGSVGKAKGGFRVPQVGLPTCRSPAARQLWTLTNLPYFPEPGLTPP